MNNTSSSDLLFTVSARIMWLMHHQIYGHHFANNVGDTVSVRSVYWSELSHRPLLKRQEPNRCHLHRCRFGQPEQFWARHRRTLVWAITLFCPSMNATVQDSLLLRIESMASSYRPNTDVKSSNFIDPLWAQIILMIPASAMLNSDDWQGNKSEPWGKENET